MRMEHLIFSKHRCRGFVLVAEATIVLNPRSQIKVIHETKKRLESSKFGPNSL
jgi:hypothetical protein